jgi:HEAT repeat protein
MEMKDIIKEIADADKPLVNSHLAELSRLTATDMPLLKSVWKSIDVKRRRQVITRLAELAKDSVELTFDLVYKYALSDPDAEVRTASIDGLWENEDPLLIGKYIRLMESDSSSEVQAAAASALSKFAVLAECGEIRSDYTGPISTALLATIDNTGKPVEVRRRALESAAPLSLPAIREAIKKAYDSRDERFVISAIYAMGRTCDEAWLPILYKELDNPNAEIRYEAAGACGEIGDESSVSHLMEHIYDSDIEVRLAMIQALAKIGGKEAQRGLQKVARDPNEAIREAVAQALSEIKTMENMTLFEMDLPGERDDNRN